MGIGNTTSSYIKSLVLYIALGLASCLWLLPNVPYLVIASGHEPTASRRLYTASFPGGKVSEIAQKLRAVTAKKSARNLSSPRVNSAEQHEDIYI